MIVRRKQKKIMMIMIKVLMKAKGMLSIEVHVMLGKKKMISGMNIISSQHKKEEQHVKKSCLMNDI